MLFYLYCQRLVLGILVLCFIILMPYLSLKSSYADSPSKHPEDRHVSHQPSEIDNTEKVFDSLVYLEIEAEDENGKRFQFFGSGFFVKPNQIATCFHVIEGATKGTVRLVGTALTSTIEGIIATDRKHDLAVLKVADLGVRPLSLGNSDTVQVGERVRVVGNPDRQAKISNGIINSIRKGDTDEFLGYLSENTRFAPQKVFQMSAQIDFGSSGGPVLNSKTEVIGISFMTFKRTEAFKSEPHSNYLEVFNFAIPSNYLQALLNKSGPTKPLDGEQSISAFTYLLWGNTKFKQEQYENAIVNFDKAIQLEPNYVIAYNNRGGTKVELDAYDAAILDFDKAIQLKPDYAETYNNRAVAKYELSAYDAAILDFDKAIQLKPDYAKAYRGRGLTKYELSAYDAAILDFDKAIQLKPDYALAYRERGGTKYKLGAYDAAILDFDKAIQLKPDYALAYRERGRAKSSLKQYYSAILDFDKAIQLKSDFVIAYNDRGLAKFRLGAYDDAILDLDIAIQLKPNDAEAYLSRGIAEIQLHRINEAKADFQTALRLAEQASDLELRTVIKKTIQDLD